MYCRLNIIALIIAGETAEYLIIVIIITIIIIIIKNNNNNNNNNNGLLEIVRGCTSLLSTLRIGFMDDITLAGDITAVEADVSTIQDRGAEIGLNLISRNVKSLWMIQQRSRSRQSSIIS